MLNGHKDVTMYYYERDEREEKENKKCPLLMRDESRRKKCTRRLA
jgi:hypothetical protein